MPIYGCPCMMEDYPFDQNELAHNMLKTLYDNIIKYIIHKQLVEKQINDIDFIDELMYKYDDFSYYGNIGYKGRD